MGLKRRRGIGGYHAAMAEQNNPSELQLIARRAMREHALEPDFAPAVAEQLRSMTTAAMERGAQIRDLRALPWCSIDNDDSRDLDQLSVAQPLDAGKVKILVAIADVDASVAPGSPGLGESRDSVREALLLGLVNHGDADAVFHGAAGIHVVGLDVDFGLEAFGEAIEADEGRAAHGFEDVIALHARVFFPPAS